jgi:hypothetical protein
LSGGIYNKGERVTFDLEICKFEFINQQNNLAFICFEKGFQQSTHLKNHLQEKFANYIAATLITKITTMEMCNLVLLTTRKKIFEEHKRMCLKLSISHVPLFI